ncbi:probable ATP dependent RNA helicase [Cephalotrichum gorgonifer]|uniref:Probable ATP dependent RNA helicase n=1 Tax=Cephalotrichum gorgonifer TaxID=2041049 RepID=A0AAE8SW71_9PEZI|nr:probable ATP dependent RNA helicase [Cephalotrichum gorgonifer]
MDDLFDVFEAPPQVDNGPDSDSPPPAATENTRKRKSDGVTKDGDKKKADETMTDASEEAPASDEHEQKRRKKEEEDRAPVLTDTFETAASRELEPEVETLVAEKEEEGAVVVSHNIQHQVALPPDLDYEYIPLSEHKPPAEPARTYPFKLDPFQALSVASIERDESVLVSAHTSAGKTVVAEYAIAQCLKKNQRVIYTSPIKALSNQKYRDFDAIFGDVGLMTGDITINPTASCLVMTTEILRSMLYRGSEIMREVAWVVFDEVHYLREKTRGVVWEETIILLPDKVRYVFLSATIPNAFQFAEWIAKIHHQACHVVYTDFRPTPLQNFFFPAGHDGIYLVVDEKRVFKEANFTKAMALVEDRKKDANEPNSVKGKGKKKGAGGGGGNDDQKADIKKIIKMVIKKKFDPVIIFSFSKREVEAMALQIASFSLNNDSEKQVVRRVFSNAIMSLSEADRELPQIANILPLLERGIGVHHSGLLPILKETIEILFQESLIKVLFATETFSIGLNMPAKTVVFSKVTKWDGHKNRPLTAGEYIQMSGRAGRRGLDDRGIVIMMIDESMEPDTAKQVVIGEQECLNSAFYLGYNMVLNLLRIEAVSPEYMLERCFFQFQNASSVPKLEKELAALQQERDSLTITDESTMKDYYNLRKQINAYTRDVRWVIQHPDHCSEFLQPGRLVRIFDPQFAGEEDDVLVTRDFGWGIILRPTSRRRTNMAEKDYPPQESVLVDVLLNVAPNSPVNDYVFPNGSQGLPKGFAPAAKGETSRFERVPCLLTCIHSISQIRLHMPKDADSTSERTHLRKALNEVQRRFPDGVPLLDPLENMGISDDSFKQLLRKIEVLESRLLANPLHESPELPQLWEQYRSKVKLGEKIKSKKKDIAKAQSVVQLDELKSRKRVLRRLGFINENEVVQLKARVACEISSTEGHELLLSELLFERFFNEMTPEMCAATLSCFVFDEKVNAAALPETLAKPYREIVAKARIVARVSQESKLDVDEDEYVEKLKWQLMETVLAWAQGKPFIEICKMADVYEGSLIRHFRRLEELIRQMGQASKVMGSDDLTQKFEDSLVKIRRDIVAAQSLYL